MHSWPKLCFLALDGGHCFGTVVCKMDVHGELLRGYIAMLVVEHAYRGLGVGPRPERACAEWLLTGFQLLQGLSVRVCCAGTQLVRLAIQEIVAGGADEVVLEAEVTNGGALALYEGLGFLRDKRLLRCVAATPSCAPPPAAAHADCAAPGAGIT